MAIIIQCNFCFLLLRPKHGNDCCIALSWTPVKQKGDQKIHMYGDKKLRKMEDYLAGNYPRLKLLRRWKTEWIGSDLLVRYSTLGIQVNCNSKL